MIDLVSMTIAASALLALVAWAGRAVWQRSPGERGRAALLARGYKRTLLLALLTLLAYAAAVALAAEPTLRQLLGLSLGALIATLAWQGWRLRRPVAAEPTAGPRQPTLIDDYISLTKPKVISLLLVTTLAAMFITPAGMPSLALIFWTMLGGYLAAGGAGAINCAFDGDIDNVMGRTSRRPVPSGRVSRRNALIFGVVLNVLAFAVLYIFATPLAAVLALVGTVYYAWFYTCVLKRSTWQNIVIGGGAGAIPPLVGWTAMTGSLSLTALYLFIIIFYWTPPHFWALALIKEKDYARAGVPMLPVVAGERETRWQIVLYSLLLVVITLMLPALEAMGAIYLVLATILGALFMRYAWRVWREGSQAPIWGLYKYSLLYLALLFGAMVLDRVILG
jgi:heme o synthase